MNYQSILADFRSLGYKEDSYLSLQQLQKSLNSLIRNSLDNGTTSYDAEVLGQLWGQCEQNPNRNITVGQFAQVVLQAKDILEERLLNTENKMKENIRERDNIERQITEARSGRNENLFGQLRQRLLAVQGDLKGMQLDFQGFQEDLLMIMLPFAKNKLSYKQLVESVYKQVQPQHTDRALPLQSQVFMKRSSVALTSLFYLTISTLGGELLMSFQKYNFPGLLMSILVLSMFILNYFNSKFIRLILVMISANVVLDTVWFFRYSGSYWSPGVYSELPAHYSGFLKLILLGMIMTATLKVLMFLILMSYINIQQAGEVDSCCFTIKISPGVWPFQGDAPISRSIRV